MAWPLVEHTACDVAMENTRILIPVLMVVALGNFYHTFFLSASQWFPKSQLA